MEFQINNQPGNRRLIQGSGHHLVVGGTSLLALAADGPGFGVEQTFATYPATVFQAR